MTDEKKAKNATVKLGKLPLTRSMEAPREFAKALRECAEQSRKSRVKVGQSPSTFFTPE